MSVINIVLAWKTPDRKGAPEIIHVGTNYGDDLKEARGAAKRFKRVELARITDTRVIRLPANTAKAENAVPDEDTRRKIHDAAVAAGKAQAEKEAGSGEAPASSEQSDETASSDAELQLPSE